MSQCECNSDDNLNLATYERIIHILYEEHNKHTKEWLETQPKTYNLGKTCICDICSSDKNGKIITENFKEYIYSYINSLMSLYFKILERIDNECNISIRGRIKSEESIILKIYNKNNQDTGKFPIEKCLNDLLGFRIIDPKYDENIDSLLMYFDGLAKESKMRIRHLNRLNGEYIAYHVYFRGADNKYFPIELQIWDAKNEAINLGSHESYKKEYTNWPKEYKELLERGE